MNPERFRFRKWFQIFLVGFVSAILALSIACSSVGMPAESTVQSSRFDINATFTITFDMPKAPMVVVAESPASIGLKRGLEERLIWARYDPGSGREKDIHLTTIWLTLYRFPENELDRTKDRFTQIKSVFFEHDPDFTRNVKYSGYENINDRSWLNVEFTSEYRQGAAYTAEIFENYVLIAGVRVFGETGENDELRERRVNTLTQIVRSIRVAEL